MLKIIRRKIISKAKGLIAKDKLNSLMLKHNITKLSHNRIDLLEMMQTLKVYVSDFDILIDVGANEGVFAETFKYFKNFNDVIFIEPNKSLNDTIRNNNKGVNSFIINKALSDKIQDCEYFFHEDSQMNSLINSDTDKLSNDFGDKEIGVESLQTSTLDLEIENCPIEISGKNVFLKLDTQGNEIDILHAGLNILKKTKYCLIEYMESSPYLRKSSLEDIIFLMQSSGFECIGPVYLKKRKNFEVGATNFLFIKA